MRNNSFDQSYYDSNFLRIMLHIILEKFGEHYSYEAQGYITLLSAESLIEFFQRKLSREPQTLRDGFYLTTHVLNADDKHSSARLADFIKTCQNINVED
jgi:hypothetical protein